MPRRVLIVDDHATFRGLARRLLEAAGFDVVGEAADAAAGVRRTDALAPDAVLLDVMLPDRSGFEVARELRAAHAAMRIVLVSSRTAEDFGAALTEAPADAFLTKAEFSAETLCRALA